MENNMKNLPLILPIALSLTACGTPSVEELIQDQQLLGEINQECIILMSQGKDANTIACKNANAAMKILASNLVNGMMKQNIQIQ